MKKDILYISWFSYFMGITLSLFLICFSVGLLVLSYFLHITNNPDLSIVLSIAIFYTIVSPYFIYILLKNFVQWVEISETEIVSRNLFKVIKRQTWDNLIRIEQVSMNYSAPGSKMNFIEFIDCNNDVIGYKHINIKDQNIVVRATKRNITTIKKYYDNAIK